MTVREGEGERGGEGEGERGRGGEGERGRGGEGERGGGGGEREFSLIFSRQPELSLVELGQT